MSYANGPKIVTDSLTLCIDAANAKSYPGTGSTVYNLAPYTYNGSFISTSANTSWNSNGYWQVSDYHCLMWYDGYSGNGTNISTLEWAYDGKFIYSGGWSTNNWYHIVGTGSRANSRMRVYRNGTLVASSSVTARNPLGPGSVRPFAVNKNVEDSVDTQYGSTGYTSIVRIYGKELFRG